MSQRTDNYPNYLKERRGSAYSNTLLATPVKNQYSQYQYSRNTNYVPAYDNYTRPTSNVGQTSQSASGTTKYAYQNLRATEYQKQSTSSNDYMQGYVSRQEKIRNKLYSHKVPSKVDQMNSSIKTSSLAKSSNPFTKESIAKFNDRISKCGKDNIQKEIEVFMEVVQMIPISDNGLSQQESTILQSDIMDLANEKSQNKLQTSSMLIMIFRFFLQSQEYQFFLKRLKNVANTKINFKSTPKKTQFNQTMNSDQKHNEKENDYKYSQPLDHSNLKLKDKLKSQPLNNSIVVDEEDASTTDQEKQNKTEPQNAEILYQSQESKSMYHQTADQEQMQMKLGRMTITSPYQPGQKRNSIDLTGYKEESKALNTQNNQNGSQIQNQDEQRIKNLYDKLMKSDYESSFDNQYKAKNKEYDNQDEVYQKVSGPDVLEIQREAFSLRPQKCFNSKDLMQNKQSKLIKSATKSSVTQTQAYKAIEQLLDKPSGSLVKQFVAPKKSQTHANTSEKVKYSNDQCNMTMVDYQRSTISPYQNNDYKSKALDNSFDNALYDKYQYQKELRIVNRFTRF